jgi:uncharacterized protein
MKPNRLINEKSPYLIQHARNPVDWHPWSDEVFEKAARLDKPVFLSIGYAACHWCHVMEKESFEDEEAAGYINDAFIPVKVDREERPDVDAVYMAVCQMLTGRGGWPLTILMTPDKKPFFAGTYIPKGGRTGQGGLIDLCRQVKRLWDQDRAKAMDAADSIAGHLAGAFSLRQADAVGEPVLSQAYEMIRASYDSHYGGFDSAPKFPTPHRFGFLLRHYHRTGDPDALNMVRHTLSAMRRGGIWDHVGFGFHRYSTDDRWLLPHFEKMLYDQALLAVSFLETFQITTDPFFAQTAEEIFTYVLRDMTDAEGGFYAAEDADSEGEEGKFYVWGRSEFIQVLGPEEGPLWADLFNLTLEGNFTDEATKQKTGFNIPHLTTSPAEWAATIGIQEPEAASRWEAARRKLFDYRRQRIHPLKDDKILTDWNGLMIAALALGGRVLKQPEYTTAAESAAGFIQNRMQTPDGRLLHRYRDGEAGISAHADDYAFMIRGLCELYRTTFDPAHLAWAVRLQEQMLADFWDADNGGFFLTAAASRDLPVRPKSLYDGAIPSANSMALLNLLWLSRMTGRTGWAEQADALVRSVAGSVGAHPSGYTQFLVGADFASGRHLDIVLTGDPEDASLEQMKKALDEGFFPHQVVLCKPSGSEGKLADMAPFTALMEPVDGKAAAYVCRNFACDRPITDLNELKEAIRKGN